MTNCWFCCKNGHNIESGFHVIGYDETTLNQPCLNVKTKNPCPPFISCCEKELIERMQTDIPITYCPICGRKVFESEVKPNEMSVSD